MNKKHESYLNNPYKMRGIEEKYFTTKNDEELTVDPNTGQYYTMKKVDRNKKVLNDGLTYTKVFHGGIETLMLLSHSSLKIVLYAMSTIRPLSEIVILNSPDVCQACNIASKTFYNNIGELLDQRILSRKLGSSIEFWFDPNVFFNGNRIRVLK